MDVVTARRLTQPGDVLQELSDLSLAVGRDAQRALTEQIVREKTGVADPYLDRNAVRTVFAYAEAHLFLLKRLALAAHTDADPAFTPAEVAALREEAYTLDGEGKVGARVQFPTFLANTRLTFAMVSKAFALGALADYSTIGWEHVRTALRVRNRLTHPKAARDLEIFDEDRTVVRGAYDWFVNTFRTYMEAMGRHTRQVAPFWAERVTAIAADVVTTRFWPAATRELDLFIRYINEKAGESDDERRRFAMRQLPYYFERVRALPKQFAGEVQARVELLLPEAARSTEAPALVRIAMSALDAAAANFEALGVRGVPVPADTAATPEPGTGADEPTASGEQQKSPLAA